ncbi:hypothetical protein [Albimonas pacifica]|uniref:Invasion protein IalB, involved in pathogenesis n=1 Tax=Albimonas pacifica TaxID=1114924 RepID=A0A1I3DYU5_9RHOB|nr:hypothetical protein [Albimonas pacifica]SFH91912.1 hypothetical protein SAMN05216258_10390 [Albimonas pacifica]
MTNRLAAAMVAGVMAVAAAAPAWAVNLPEAKRDVWTSHKISRGAIAQVNSRGEGRFAVVCNKTDRKGYLVYLLPKEDRGRITGGSIDVTFNFDKGRNRINRTLTWDPDGFYTDPFGPNSPLADWMKRAYDVRINVKGHKGVASDFSLKNSWVSITRMFEICD